MSSKAEIKFVIIAALVSIIFGGQARGADANKGAYIFKAANCGGCHTKPLKQVKSLRELPLAGGRPIKTPFGIMYTPNITPHRETGIGNWSFEQFRRAMINGMSPDGSPYYPAFPYTSYAGIKNDDLLDLWAYIKTQRSIYKVNRKHELSFPFNMRILMHAWRLFFFSSETTRIKNFKKSTEWNRGAYLVRVLSHCGECHTPRNYLGAMDKNRELSGSDEGSGTKIPDLTSENIEGISNWTVEDIIEYLGSGMTPDGDFAGGKMAEVIHRSTALLTILDRRAIARFLKGLK